MFGLLFWRGLRRGRPALGHTAGWPGRLSSCCCSGKVWVALAPGLAVLGGSLVGSG